MKREEYQRRRQGTAGNNSFMTNILEVHNVFQGRNKTHIAGLPIENVRFLKVKAIVCKYTEKLDL